MTASKFRATRYIARREALPSQRYMRVATYRCHRRHRRHRRHTLCVFLTITQPEPWVVPTIDRRRKNAA